MNELLLKLDPIKPVKKEETLKQINEKMQQAEYNRQKVNMFKLLIFF